MKLLIFLLAGYAVRCDDSSYYVIQMPENDPPVREFKKPFKVYWNVPTMQCKSKKIPFENLYEKYGIIQNRNDSFRGEKISILYDPGLFPALLKNESSGKFKFRNGGVPQEGDLEKHLESFRSVLDQSIPDKDFSGVGIIDFESWRPVFRQNSGVLVPYKDVSYELEKKMHWWWPKTWIQAEAKQRFEKSARQFMQTTLSVAKQMRPNALWGYYGFPYCFNMANNNLRESCADKVPEENDRTHWLWSESSALYPSVYSAQALSARQLSALVRGRVREAERVASPGASGRAGGVILPYVWYRYRDGGYLREKDLEAALQTLYESEASGFIIWGSSNDVNSVTKCKKLLNYIETVFGPAIAKYVKPAIRLQDETNDMDSTNIKISSNITTVKPILNDETPANDNTMKIDANNITSTTLKPLDEYVSNDTKLQPDPDYHWDPPENYTQDIKQYVEDEILKKTGHNVSLNIKDNVSNKESLLFNLLLHLLTDNHTKTIDKDLLTNSEIANTTTSVDFVSGQIHKTEIDSELSKDEKKDAISNRIGAKAIKMNTEMPEDYNSTTEKIDTESSSIDRFYDTFDNNTYNESSTIYTDVATESTIDNESTTKDRTETTEYYRVNLETSTVTDYQDSLEYIDENFFEVNGTDRGVEEPDNGTSLSLPSTTTMDQVNVFVL